MIPLSHTLRRSPCAEPAEILRDPRFFLPTELQALLQAGLIAQDALWNMTDDYRNAGTLKMWEDSLDAQWRIIKIIENAQVCPL